MIKGVEVIEILGKDGRVTHFKYKGFEFYQQSSIFDKMKKSDFEKLVQESISLSKETKSVSEEIRSKSSSLTKEERKSQEEADRVIFERWQDESNTNAILDGIDDEYDGDLNPFRRD